MWCVQKYVDNIQIENAEMLQIKLDVGSIATFRYTIWSQCLWRIHFTKNYLLLLFFETLLRIAKFVFYFFKYPKILMPCLLCEIKLQGLINPLASIKLEFWTHTYFRWQYNISSPMALTAKCYPSFTLTEWFTIISGIYCY